MTYLIYFLGPLLGSVIAVGAYQFFTSAPSDLDEEFDDEHEDEMEPEVEEPKKPVARETTARKTVKLK